MLRPRRWQRTSAASESSWSTASTGMLVAARRRPATSPAAAWRRSWVIAELRVRPGDRRSARASRPSSRPTAGHGGCARSTSRCSGIGRDPRRRRLDRDERDDPQRRPEREQIHRRLSVPSEMNSDAVRKPIAQRARTRASAASASSLALVQAPGRTQSAAQDAPIIASSSASPTIPGLRHLLEIHVVRHVRLVDDQANELERRPARGRSPSRRPGEGEPDARHRVVAGHAPRDGPQLRAAIAAGVVRRDAVEALRRGQQVRAGRSDHEHPECRRPQALPAGEEHARRRGPPAPPAARHATRWPRGRRRCPRSRRPVRACRRDRRTDGMSPRRQRDRRHEAGREVVGVTLAAREALTGGEVKGVGRGGQAAVAGQPDDNRDERADHEREDQHARRSAVSHRVGHEEEARRGDVPRLGLRPGERAVARPRHRQRQPHEQQPEGQHGRATSMPTRTDFPRAHRVRRASRPGAPLRRPRGARPVKCEYSIHATGTHAAIASGGRAGTSATNAHAPTSISAEPRVARSRPPAAIATTTAAATTSRCGAALPPRRAGCAPAVAPGDGLTTRTGA